MKTLNELNLYLADVAVDYIKFHNLHWNVVGKNFKEIHEYLEEQYDSLAKVLDEVAEVLKMNAFYPSGSLKEYLEITQIKELESKDYNEKDTLSILKNDLIYLKEKATSIRNLADQEGFFTIVSMLEDQVQEYVKAIWFVDSMLK